MNDKDITAFPLKEPLTSDSVGMTLRDYFAAKALPSLLNQAYSDDGHPFFEAVAYDAYKMADAMLEARQR